MNNLYFYNSEPTAVVISSNLERASLMISMLSLQIAQWSLLLRVKKETSPNNPLILVILIVFK